MEAIINLGCPQYLSYRISLLKAEGVLANSAGNWTKRSTDCFELGHLNGCVMAAFVERSWNLLKSLILN